MDAAGFDAAGWYAPARRYPSPNCDARPAGEAIELLVIHNISLPGGCFGTPHVPDLFTNRIDLTADPSFATLRGLEVSAHFLIRRDGRVLQFVPVGLRAWHAGSSSFEGRAQCNGFSVGVEVEGTDAQPFEPAQYRALAALTRALVARYPIRAIAGHEHIAPGRKTDPGPAFDWPAYAALLADVGTDAGTDECTDEAALATAHRVVAVVPGSLKVKMRT
jgi:AmpD protein